LGQSSMKVCSNLVGDDKVQSIEKNLKRDRPEPDRCRLTVSSASSQISASRVECASRSLKGSVSRKNTSLESALIMCFMIACTVRIGLWSNNKRSTQTLRWVQLASTSSTAFDIIEAFASSNDCGPTRKSKEAWVREGSRWNLDQAVHSSHLLTMAKWVMFSKKGSWNWGSGEHSTSCSRTDSLCGRRGLSAAASLLLGRVMN